MKKYKSDVIIIGSGAAGYTAAIYTARANMKPILVNGQQPGGQMTITTDVENYPGFKDVIQGPWLMEQMKGQAESVGTKIINDTILECNFKSEPFELIGDSKSVYHGKSIIIATGATARWLGLESEERLFKNKKIEIIWDSNIKKIQGDSNPKKVKSILIENTKTNKEKIINLNGVFIAIGHDPATKIFKNKINLDNDGYIVTENGNTNTNIPGIFAAGDVTDKIYRQAVTAAGMGCMAALDAEKYLAN